MFVNKATVGPGKSAIKPMLIFSCSSLSYLSATYPNFSHVVTVLYCFILY